MASRLRNEAEHKIRMSTPWVKKLARVGYLAKGIIYATVGVLALGLAIGEGGRTTDTQGAVQTLAHQPFGKFLLALIAIGLPGLIAWRLVQAMTVEDGAGPGHGKEQAKPWLKRLGYLVTAGIYTVLFGATVRALMGQPGRGGSGTRDWTERLMSVPFGRVLVLAVGLSVLAYGIHEIREGITRRFERKLALRGLAAEKAHWVKRVSQFGLIARGFVFGLMGAFLAQAAIRFDPDRARGLGETLSTLAGQPMGDLLLGVVALGLVAFAAYCGLEARYRRFESRV